jgi:hypothetical protein
MKSWRPFLMTNVAAILACAFIAGLALSAHPARAAEDESDKARKLLQQFLIPNVDCSALTHKLMPGRQEYHAYFGQENAGRARDYYEPYWKNGQIVIRPRPGQTELKLIPIDLAALKAGKPLPEGAPQEYDKLRSRLRGGKTVYAFKFVKPGEEHGVAWDGLVRLGGQWVFFPMPWKALGD